MHIDLNIHHRCASVAEFTALSTRIAALLAEFSVAPSAPVAADPVLHTDATLTAVPPAAPVARSEPVTSTAGGATENSVPAAFAGALDEPAKRKRRTKAEMEAARASEAARAAETALPAPVMPSNPAVAAAPVAQAPVDIFAAAPTPAPTAKPAAPAPVADPAGVRQHIKSMMVRLFDTDDGETKIAEIFGRYGGSLAKVPDAQLGACMADFNAALHGVA